jgi:hypothetical protein
VRIPSAVRHRRSARCPRWRKAPGSTPLETMATAGHRRRSRRRGGPAARPINEAAAWELDRPFPPSRWPGGAARSGGPAARGASAERSAYYPARRSAGGRWS